MERVKLATVWLGGCSGCHMSFLDLDERLIALAEQVDLVYSPIADAKVFPEGVDVALVEGAIANEDHLEMIHTIRARAKVLVSFGDCAVTGNVTALRNQLGGALAVLDRAYAEGSKEMLSRQPGICPKLLDKVLPVHAVVPVEAFIPGCPPDAARIHAAITELLAGKAPVVTGPKLFG